jgi:uncharacterized protein (TIGR00661 family)
MRLLFFIVGVGAGNTTRTLAVLDELKRQAPDVDIQVAAQGKALELLREHVPVHPLREITYSEGGEFSSWNIITSNLSFPIKFFQNRAEAARLMDELQPDLIIADSDFYCLGPARKKGFRLATVNNSPVIVALLKKYGIPPGCGFSAKFIERTDSWLQHRYAHRVVCPVIEPMEGLDPRIRQISPIVRPEFTPSEEPPGENVVVVTGGSGIGVNDIDLTPITAPLVTYGATVPQVPDHVDQRGFTLGDGSDMKSAKVLVVQGGFSSVSEAVALRRPTVVVPITRHAEQHMNAYLVEELGLGLAAAGPDAGKKVNEILDNYDQFAEQCRNHPQLATDGAQQAAKVLLETATEDF